MSLENTLNCYVQSTDNSFDVITYPWQNWLKMNKTTYYYNFENENRKNAKKYKIYVSLLKCLLRGLN